VRDAAPTHVAVRAAGNGHDVCTQVSIPAIHRPSTWLLSAFGHNIQLL
jgi:hypothetical protein